jgi:ketosteroid isomerase-like protein
VPTLSSENAEIIRRHFADANRRDFDAAAASFAEDVELVVPGPDVLAGTYSGRQAVRRFFGDWYRTFGDSPLFEPRELRHNGEAVALAAHATGRGRLSGVEVSVDCFYVYRIHDCKIVHIQFYRSWPEALEAAELQT